MNKVYKLVSIDIDGTLLGSNRLVSEKTKEAIKRATELGVKIVITSGRPINRVIDLVKELGLDKDEEYVIANNGSTVHNTKDLSIIYERHLRGKDLKRVYKVFKRDGLAFEAHMDRGSLVEKDIVNVLPNNWRLSSSDTKIIDLNKELDDEEKVIKFLIISKVDVLEDIYEDINKKFSNEYSIVRSFDHLCEFMYKGCNKATGLMELGKHLGIKQDEIMSIGDELNDFEMIEYAGLGVAMGNARDEIKNIANYITKSNDEDGVAYALEKFIINAK
nr:Cof-type HAD-IIB family hydrolase [Clostridium paridis]